jgi:UDP-glucose 4-epimerase
LLAKGYTVVGVDNFFSGYPHNMASFRDNPGFAFYERSITETGLLSELHRRHLDLAYCFHLAAVVSVPYSVAHPEETMEINHRATLALLGEAARLQVRAFVFAGSAAEYGDDTRMPLREDYPTEHGTHHVSPYGRAKFLASRPAGVALRCFNIYGPRQDPSSPYSGVISRFIEMGVKNEPLTIFGDGGQTRDFVYVADVVEAYLHAAGLHGSASGSPPSPAIYNVATGSAASVLELAENIKKLTGNSKDIVFLPERPGDIRHSLAAIERFWQATGWKPRMSLLDGLRETLEWARPASAPSVQT